MSLNFWLIFGHLSCVLHDFVSLSFQFSLFFFLTVKTSAMSDANSGGGVVSYPPAGLLPVLQLRNLSMFFVSSLTFDLRLLFSVIRSSTFECNSLMFLSFSLIEDLKELFSLTIFCTLEFEVLIILFCSSKANLKSLFSLITVVICACRLLVIFVKSSSFPFLASAEDLASFSKKSFLSSVNLLVTVSFLPGVSAFVYGMGVYAGNCGVVHCSTQTGFLSANML